MHGHAVIGEQGVQEIAENTPLWGPSVEDQRCGDLLPTLATWELPVSLEGTMVLNAEL